ncbi:IclR family transcriptional regulator [Arthrobacter sp. SPG23]|uniref:IclR family transcriptional regulator n=1 Tax=Arthrobacter sp. SPG23 TaxID=1610703 RepID=UPI0005B9F8F3|nr:IclR family transcriptional regulator C-terminal domain-containing protein [Arthrobacter sp. SPG23]KIS27585.1 IclR family transcriptional regulator [Arthrobacter sp. SPG23]
MSTIQLLKKASQMVDELARIGQSTPAELAKVISEPRPTVYRIVAALEQAKLVRSAGDGRLELGTAILKLGDAAADALVDRAELHSQLRWVRGQLGMSAYFCVLRENGAVCLDQVEGSDVTLLDLAPGRTIPLHAGAASQALLASASAEFQAAVLQSGPYGRIASQTPLTAEALRKKIEQAAVRGWSVEDSEVTEGVASVGVPVFRRDGSLLGAVAVAGLRGSVLGHEAIARQTLDAAAQAITAFTAEDGANDARDTAGSEEPQGSEREAPRTPAVIAKASALMAALAEERIATSARLTELLEEPVSSVYRMLATLAEAGWVEQIGHRGAYRVGSKLVALSGEFSRRADIRRAAAPILRAIHEATGETTFLCIRRGTRAVCIDRIDGIRVNSRVLQLGESLPLHVGAAPRALLAFEGRESWEEYAAIAANTGEPWLRGRSRSEFYAELEEIKEHGFVLSDNQVTPGIAAVGAPIFNHRGEVAASLSVSGMREGLLAPPDGDPIAELVVRGARALSDYLGAPPFPAANDADVFRAIVDRASPA